MLQDIDRKRTRAELEAWGQLHQLMPRGRSTRGLQYELLEFLFDRLYEKVSEQELFDHLIQVRGRLQATGDPVKGAINQAVKELQRLPDRAFNLVKLQESDHLGRPLRYVKLSFARFDEVVDFNQFRDYVEDLLANEKRLVVRSVYNLHGLEPIAPFPGLAGLALAPPAVECVLNLAVYHEVREFAWDVRFVPDNPATQCYMLLYESETAHDPFLAFVCDASSPRLPEASHFILYRGQGNFSKLRFLDRLWRELFASALTPADVAELEVVAKANRGDLPLPAVVNGLASYRLSVRNR